MDNNSSGSPGGSPQDACLSDDDLMDDEQDYEGGYSADYGNSGVDGMIGVDGQPGVPGGGAIRRHRRKQQAGQHMVCTICGDDACGYNFDALTCHSCKLFFRRNAFRTLSCPFSKACQIDKVRRKFCAACRLAKCFEKGMKREFIKVAPVTSGSSAGSSGANNMSTNREPKKSPKVENATTPTQSVIQGGANVSNSSVLPDSASINHMVSALSVKAEPTELNDSLLRKLPPGSIPSQLSNAFPGMSLPPGMDLFALQQAGLNLSSLQQAGIKLPQGQAGGQPQLPFGGQLPFPIGGSSGNAEQLPFGLTMDQLRMAFAGQSDADRQRLTSGDDAGHVSSYSQPESPSSTSVSSGPTICRPLYNPLEESVSLSEFDYDRLLMVCSTAWKVAVSPVNAAEFEEATNKSRQNAQMCILSALSRALFEYFNYIDFGVRKTVSAFKQVPEFREMSQTVQMKLLKAATLSVLNVSAVFIFDADKQQWVVTTTDGQKRCFSVNDIVPLLEKLGHAEIGDYMLHYVRFHTELRHVFADDNVVLFTIVLLDLFSPNRFELHDPEMTAILSPIHAKFAVFLKRYIKRHYKAVFATSGGGAVNAMPRIGHTNDDDLNRQDDYSATDDEIESASVVNETFGLPSAVRIGSASDTDSKFGDGDTSSSSPHSLVAFVFDKLNDHARTLEAYLMRLSARMLVHGSALSPLLREVLQIAESAFEYQLNQPDSN